MAYSSELIDLKWQVELIEKNTIYSQDKIICPYCKTEYSRGGHGGKFECFRCHRTFTILIANAPTYVSTPHLKELVKVREKHGQNQ